MRVFLVPASIAVDNDTVKVVLSRILIPQKSTECQWRSKALQERIEIAPKHISHGCLLQSYVDVKTQISRIDSLDIMKTLNVQEMDNGVPKVSYRPK